MVKAYANFGPGFTIAFDMKLTKVPVGWHNILHMTTGRDCCFEGSRIPGVWLNSSYGIIPYMLIDIVMKGPKKQYSMPLEMNKQYYIELVLEAGIFTVRVNGDQVSQIEAGTATYNNVKCYLSSPLVESAGKVAVLSMTKIQQG